MESELESSLAISDQTIDEYDLSFVHERIRDEGLLAGEDIQRVEIEFKKFIKLVALESGPLAVIDERVDAFWHSFILFTPQYREFCERVLGFFADHQPRTSLTPVAVTAIPNFLSAYTRKFGNPEPFWFERHDDNAKDILRSADLDRALELRWSGWTGR